jgi:hypothetical protein
MDGPRPLRNIRKLSKAMAVTRVNFCANSVPPSVALIQNGTRKSAKCAAPHLFVIPVNLPIRSVRNATAVILIVEHSMGFPECQVLGVLFTAPLNDDTTVPKALQKFTCLNMFRQDRQELATDPFGVPNVKCLGMTPRFSAPRGETVAGRASFRRWKTHMTPLTLLGHTGWPTLLDERWHCGWFRA